MAVELFKEREAVVVKWEPGDYEGKVRLVTHSTDDISETVYESNAGFGAVTFPKGEAASFKAEIFSEPDGQLIDEGTVEVGLASITS